MKRALGLIVLLVSSFFLASCGDARMDQRKPAYDPSRCPACMVEKGLCETCNGKKICAHCNGTGIFTESTKNVSEPNIVQTTVAKTCPFCNGTKVCAHCEGKGSCSKCGGDGKIENWNFDGKYETKMPQPGTASADTASVK